MFRLGWREEGGGGWAEGEQRGRNEGGREKCASLNTHDIETTMSVNYGCVSTSSKVAVHHRKENSLNPSYFCGLQTDHELLNA